MSNPAGPGTPANWYPDPSGRHQLRYWDGTRWTENISNAGVVGRDDPVSQPGAPPPPAAWGQQQSARPLTGLATALTVLLVLTAVAAAATAIALFNRVSVLDDVLAADDFFAFVQDVDDADSAVASTAAFFFVLALATAVVWIIWQFRHAKNARLLGQSDGLGPGWAIGGWFIPIGNLVLPQLQLQQAAKATDAAAGGEGKAPPVLVVWWVLFALGGLGRFVANNNADPDLDDLEQFRTNDQIAAVGMLLVVAAAVAAILMVRRLSARQYGALEERGLLRNPVLS